MKKVLNYDTLGWALKSLSDACFKAAEQQKNGEKVTACGMSDDDLDNLCEQIPDMLNPYMTAAGKEGGSYQRIYSKKGHCRWGAGECRERWGPFSFLQEMGR